MHCSRKANRMESTNPEGVRRGAWSKQEDTLLKKCIETYGEGRWHLVPLRAGLNRCRKSCRLRWVNYLSPDIKRSYFTTDEVDLLIRLHKLLGNRWSLIAGRIPGRTANDVKNFWNTHISRMPYSKKTKKSVEKTKIIKPKPHKLAASDKQQQPFSEEPQQNLEWFGNGTTPLSIQMGPPRRSDAGDNCSDQINGGDGLSEFSMGLWELLGFGDV